MTIFLIALAVGFVAAVGLWALGRRTPPPAGEQRPRPIADNLLHIAVVFIWLGFFGSNFYDAWKEMDQAIWMLQTASSPDHSPYRSFADLTAFAAGQVRDARLDLVGGAAAITLMVAALFVFTFRLIAAIRLNLAKTSAKPEETHA